MSPCAHPPASMTFTWSLHCPHALPLLSEPRGHILSPISERAYFWKARTPPSFLTLLQVSLYELFYSFSS